MILKGPALVCLSGGQDSAICAAYAKTRHPQVSAICFDYGQRNRMELDFASAVAGGLELPYEVFDLFEYGMAVKSPLTDVTQDVMRKDPGKLPAAFTPGRNLIFFSIAMSIAYARGIPYLYSGVRQSGPVPAADCYPDCRRQFLDQLEKTFALAIGKTRPPVRIMTPLMYENKSYAFRLAKKLGMLGLVLESTMTCYNASLQKNDWGLGCGECTACQSRFKGWLEFRGDAVRINGRLTRVRP